MGLSGADSVSIRHRWNASIFRPDGDDDHDNSKLAGDRQLQRDLPRPGDDMHQRRRDARPGAREEDACQLVLEQVAYAGEVGGPAVASTKQPQSRSFLLHACMHYCFLFCTSGINGISLFWVQAG